MAVKKSAAKKDVSATPTKAAATDGAKTTPKKGGATKGATKGDQGRRDQVVRPEGRRSRPPSTKGGEKAPKAAKAKAAPIKLTSSQTELLKKVHGAGEGGYSADKKIEERSLTALLERKLIKKGAKNKETGKVPHTLSTAGKKHIEGSGGASS